MPSEPAFFGLYAENALLSEHFWYHKIYFSIIYRFGVWCRTFRGYRAVSFGFLPPIGFVDKKYFPDSIMRKLTCRFDTACGHKQLKRIFIFCCFYSFLYIQARCVQHRASFFPEVSGSIYDYFGQRFQTLPNARQNPFCRRRADHPLNPRRRNLRSDGLFRRGQIHPVAPD